MALIAAQEGVNFATDAESLLGIIPTLEPAAVLVIDADVTSVRALLTPLERAARTSTPLVLVANGFADEVISTLEVNAIQGTIRLIAATAGDSTRTHVCELTGAAPLSAGDLQAGYLPDDSVGRCRAWSATAHGSRIVLDQA